MQTFTNRFYLKSHYNIALRALTNLKRLKRKNNQDSSNTYVNRYERNKIGFDDSRNDKKMKAISNGKIAKSDSFCLQNSKTINPVIPNTYNSFNLGNLIDQPFSEETKYQQNFLNYIKAKKEMKNKNLSSSPKQGKLTTIQRYYKSEEKIQYNPFIYNCLKHSYDNYIAHKNLLENQSICDIDLLKISKWPSDKNNQENSLKEYYFTKLCMKSELNRKHFQQKRISTNKLQELNHFGFRNEKFNNYLKGKYHEKIQSFNNQELGLPGISDAAKDSKDLGPSIIYSYKNDIMPDLKTNNKIFNKISEKLSKEGINLKYEKSSDFQ